MDILIGCDPELFLVRKSNGLFHSAHGIIPGDKKNPFKVDKGAVQVDGMALEFNIDPAKTADEFLTNIRTVMAQLRAMVPDEFEFSLTPTATFTKDHFDLQPETAKELGCDPDFDAYTLNENPRPDNATTMRTAAGHVHIGFTEGADVTSVDHMVKCATLCKELDKFLLMPSLMYDDDCKRRQMYGNPGAFRPKPYGVEYRTLSNRWLSDDDLIKWVFNQTKKCVENLVEKKGQTTEFYPGMYTNNPVYHSPRYVLSALAEQRKKIFGDFPVNVLKKSFQTEFSRNMGLGY